MLVDPQANKRVTMLVGGGGISSDYHETVWGYPRKTRKSNVEPKELTGAYLSTSTSSDNCQ